MSRRREPSSGSESLDSEEEERRKDIKERDAFSKRLKEKDESKTRKIVEASSSAKKAVEEAAKRAKLDSKDRDSIVPKLREQSRRDYLKKRKQSQLHFFAEKTLAPFSLSIDVDMLFYFLII